MKAIASAILLSLFATAINGQAFTCAFAASAGQCALTGLTGFYLTIPYTVPFGYATFYYSGVGPYHEYDGNLDQQYWPLYEDLTSSMHFEEYGFSAWLGATASVQMGFGGTNTGTNPYYTVAFNVEVDVIKLTPYKQIFFFTRPWDINEPAGMGPDMEGADTEDDTGSADGEDDTEGDDGDDTEGDDGSMEDDSMGDDRLREDSEWDETDDESVFLLGDGSGSGDDSGSGSNGEEGEPQGFHMYVGAAYDFEIGKVFVSYCEGAWTGGASIWTIGTSAFSNWYAPQAASIQMRGDCWLDPELSIELNNLLPPMIQKMTGEVEIYEVRLF